MTGKDLFREVGNISDKYVTEAEETKRSFVYNATFRRSLATAACLLVCVGIYFATRTGIKEAATESGNTAPQNVPIYKEENVANGTQNSMTDVDDESYLSDIFDGGKDKADNVAEEYFPRKEEVSWESSEESNIEYERTEEPVGAEFDCRAIIDRLSAYPDDYELLIQGEAFVVLHGVVKAGMERWDKFVSTVTEGKPASIDIVQFTMEGTAIITNVTYNGDRFLMILDDTRKEWGGGVYSESYHNYLSLFQEEGKVHAYLSQEKMLTSIPDDSKDSLLIWYETEE